MFGLIYFCLISLTKKKNPFISILCSFMIELTNILLGALLVCVLDYSLRMVVACIL